MPSSTAPLNNLVLPANRKSFVGSGLGIGLALAGLLLSSSTVLAILRTDGPDWSQKLLLGATYFRIALVLLGLIIVALSWLPWRHQPTRYQPLSADIWRGSAAWILGSLLVIGAAMRVYALNLGLWLDEILTYVNYARLPLGNLITTYSSENQHFLYSIMASFFFSVFGESSWALRLPALLFGLGSLVALYLFGTLVSNKREALLATALLTFSYHHVWFSQNARGYTGLLFWTLLASFFFIAALRGARREWWIFYAVCAALGIYTHLTMLFVVFGHGTIYLVAFYRQRRQSWPERWPALFLGLCLAAIFTLLLYSLVLPQMLDGAAASESVVDAWKNPLWTLLEFMRGLQIGFSSTLVVIAAAALFGAGLWRYAKEEYAVVMLLLVPSVVGAAVTVAVGHHLWPRFFFFTFGFGALVVVRGVYTVTEWGLGLLRLKSLRPDQLGLVFSLLMIAISAVSVPLAYRPKQDYDQALTYVTAAAEPEDTIVSVGLAGYVYENFYEADWRYVETGSELEALRSAGGDIWLVYSFIEVIEAIQPGILAVIEENCGAAEAFPGSVPAGTVVVCRIQAPQS